MPVGYCEIIIFRGGSIFVVFVDSLIHKFTSPTNNCTSSHKLEQLLMAIKSMHILQAILMYKHLPITLTQS